MEFGRNTFIAEAQELLQELDVALLTLENSPNDKSSIEYVFRIMHTLKGNSKMFDFHKISETVHDLETLYEAVRDEKRSIDKSLLDLSFQALDHLNTLLVDPNLEISENQDHQIKLIASIKRLALSDSSLSDNSTNEAISLTYHIFFKPGKSYFKDGSNPLYLIEELAEMGKILSVPHFEKIQNISQVDVTECYTYWDIFLETNQPFTSVKNVFVFAEDTAEIIIQPIQCSGLVSHRGFVKMAFEKKFVDEPIVHDEVLDMVDHLGLGKTTEPGSSSGNNKVVTSVRVGSEKLEELMNLVSELITTQARLSLFAGQSKNHELESISEVVEKLSRRLRDVSFGMTLVPINNLFNRFQRMVRDISTELGKEVKLISSGGDTELDKSIIESLADPIMHIIRNSIDHGIESPSNRESKGKASSGKIQLKAYYSGVFVYIEVLDDGQGIDLNVIRKKAAQKGIVSLESNLSDQEALDLIFHPGFSTADQITDLSGRGVGMDVVKRSISKLRGSVSVESTKGVGTKLTIKLPLTLSVIDGLLVSIESDRYLIPLSVVEKCYEIPNHKLINNFSELLTLDGVQYPFLNLRNEFDLDTDMQGTSQIVMVKSDDKYVALTVDHIIGEYQAVVKPLGKYFRHQDFVSGATILGDGTIALILDSGKLLERYIQKNQQQEIPI